MRSAFSLPLGGAALQAAALSILLASCLPVAHAQDETPPPAAPDAAAPQATAPDTTPTVPVAPAEPEAKAAPAPKDSTQLEAIEVTGSRLKRTDYESAQPVVSISREDIERSGLTDISQILRHLTVAGNNSLMTNNARFSTSLGETNLDLRNLGANHTLLLVNGHRWVTGLVSTQPSVSDLNTIPVSIIERVEVLKDGASAIYGSDAIGGVVNIITRKDFEGLGVSYQLGGFLQQGDGTNQQAAVTWGMNRPGTNIVANLSYTNQATAPNENRDVTARPSMGFARDSVVTTRGTMIIVNPSPAVQSKYNCPAAVGANQDTGLPGPLPPTVSPGVNLCTLERNVNASPTSSTMNDWHQYSKTDPNDNFNRFADGTLMEPSSRYALYTQFNQDLFEHVTFSAEGLYNRRESTSVGQNGYLAGGNYAPPVPPAGKGYYAYLSASDANNPFGQDIGKDSSCADSSSPTCTQLGTGSGVWRIRRARGLNNFNNYDTVDTARLGGGLKGDFELFDMPFFWDGGYIWSRNKIKDESVTLRFDRLAFALGHDLSGAPQTCVAPCQPLDVFHGEAGITEAAVNYVRYLALQKNQNRQDIAYLDLSTDIPTLAVLAGPLAIATGIEVRRDSYANVNDPLLSQGLLFFLNKAVDTEGKTYAREGYVELGVPLLKDLPFANVVDLDLAGRYSEYPTFGSVTTYKGGVRWKPIEDLLLRGTYSTGFRAPNVGELFLSPAQSYDPLADPCADTAQTPTTTQNCATDGAAGGGQGGQVIQPYDLWQGNLNLKPEKSKNLTYGLVYSPHWLPDFNFNLDFYDIEVTNAVTIGLGQYFLDSCYTLARPAGAPPKSGSYCQNIHRDNSGSLTYIDTPYFNYSKLKTQGVDGGFDYLLPIPEFLGRFKFAMDATYLARFDTYSPQPGLPDEVDGFVGQDTSQAVAGGFPRWKAGADLTWKRELWNASWTTRMAYHMTEPCNDVFGAADPTVAPSALGLCSNPLPPVADDPTTPADETQPDRSTNVLKTVFYHNVQIGRELPAWNAEVTFGVNNVLNQDPPLSRSNIALFWYNYDPNHYEAPGRWAYLRTSFRF